MPGVPVIERALACGLVALAMLLGALPARAASEPAVLQKLLTDKTVRDASREYEVVAQGWMLYASCKEVYPVDAEKAAFNQRVFEHVSRWYMDAMAAAHQALTGKLPSKTMLPLMAGHMKQQQITVKQKMAAQIQKQGCSANALRRLDAYWTRVRANEKEYNEQTSLKKKETE